jgi:hypothetical protein
MTEEQIANQRYENMNDPNHRHTVPSPPLANPDASCAIINHAEAHELAAMKPDSNLARCYLELEQRLADVERERDQMKEGSRLAGELACEIMVTAIAGCCDAAIVSNKQYSLADSLAAVRTMASQLQSAREELATLKADRDSIQNTIDHFDAEAAKLYPPHKWQYCEAICCLLGDAERWKAELATVKAENARIAVP